jgi:hypothetical protein
MTTLGISTNATRTAAALAGLDESIRLSVPKITRLYGEILRARVRVNASGRPGPRAQTGDYRRSIGLEVFTLGDEIYAVVGTNAPQGRRLEYGFMNMTDSLGRLFHQPPYPHFGPALEETAPQYEAALEQTVGQVIDQASESR